MSSDRNAWHTLLAALMMERRPPGFDIQSEVILTQLPQKADILMIQRKSIQVAPARVFLKLWELLSKHNLVEFKSAAALPRPETWSQLYGYGTQYRTANYKILEEALDLALILIAPSKTRVVTKSAHKMGWSFGQISPGYYRLYPDRHRIFFVALNEVAQYERDPLLAEFGSRKLKTRNKEAISWLINHTMGKAKAQIEDMDGYDELVQKLIDGIPREKLTSVFPKEVWLPRLRLEDRLAGLNPKEVLAQFKPEEVLAQFKPEEVLAQFKPEEVLAGLKPEDRLAGLKPEESILALPVETLRSLPSEYIESLPESIRTQVKQRIQS